MLSNLKLFLCTQRRFCLDEAKSDTPIPKTYHATDDESTEPEQNDTSVSDPLLSNLGKEQRYIINFYSLFP